MFCSRTFPPIPGDPLLAALFMGVFLGSGLALVYMRGSSTGGADFLVMAAKKKFPFLSMGQLALALNGLIILGSGLAYRSLDAVLYGAVATFTSSTVMDKLLYGAGSGKLALIITSNGKATAEAINLIVRRRRHLAARLWRILMPAARAFDVRVFQIGDL